MPIHSNFLALFICFIIAAPNSSLGQAALDPKQQSSEWTAAAIHEKTRRSQLDQEIVRNIHRPYPDKVAYVNVCGLPNTKANDTPAFQYAREDDYKRRVLNKKIQVKGPESYARWKTYDCSTPLYGAFYKEHYFAKYKGRLVFRSDRDSKHYFYFPSLAKSSNSACPSLWTDLYSEDDRKLLCEELVGIVDAQWRYLVSLAMNFWHPDDKKSNILVSLTKSVNFCQKTKNTERLKKDKELLKRCELQSKEPDKVISSQCEKMRAIVEKKEAEAKSQQGAHCEEPKIRDANLEALPKTLKNFKADYEADRLTRWDFRNALMWRKYRSVGPGNYPNFPDDYQFYAAHKLKELDAVYATKDSEVLEYDLNRDRVIAKEEFLKIQVPYIYNRMFYEGTNIKKLYLAPRWDLENVNWMSFWEKRVCVQTLKFNEKYLSYRKKWKDNEEYKNCQKRLADTQRQLSNCARVPGGNCNLAIQLKAAANRACTPVYKAKKAELIEVDARCANLSAIRKQR